MEKLADSLRRATKDFRDEEERTKAEQATERRTYAFEQAKARLGGAAREGKRENVVYSAESYEIDLHGYEYDWLEDSCEVIESAVQGMKGIGAERLQGIAAELRDYLISEGLKVSLRFRTEGNTCRTARYVWDVVASW